MVLLPRRTAANLWRPVLLVVALLAGWWAVTEAELVAPYILPSPETPAQAAQQNAAYLAQNTWVTTWETVIGFIIATVGRHLRRGDDDLLARASRRPSTR